MGVISTGLQIIWVFGLSLFGLGGTHLYPERGVFFSVKLELWCPGQKKTTFWVLRSNYFFIHLWLDN